MSPSTRFDGKQPIGGNATAPEYHDDEFKALRPQDCERLFRTTLSDPVTEEVTVLHHQSRYLQVWTGALVSERFPWIPLQYFSTGCLPLKCSGNSRRIVSYRWDVHGQRSLARSLGVL